MVCMIFGLVIAIYAGYAAGGDVVIYNLSTQGKCIEVTRGPTYDCRWPAGLDMVDYLTEKGRIIAYKIKWWSGQWSGWYVPGINDLDGKFNLNVLPCSIPYNVNSMRHMWSYFYDHTHMFLICKPN